MLQLDGRGYIKGTNTLYKGKVVILKRFSSKGKILLPGDVVELVGDALVVNLNLGKVRLYDEKIDGVEKAKATPFDSAQGDGEKPKRRRKSKMKNKEPLDSARGDEEK